MGHFNFSAALKFLVSLLLVSLAGCDGGGGDSLASGGIGGTGVSTGSIDGFGSVIVNGTKFNTDNATIIVNDQVASEEDLKVGFVARVEGDLGGAVADQIEFNDTVTGPVESIVINNLDANSATLKILGQTVETNTLTVFDNVDLASLALGDLVVVSGFRDGSDQVVASFIQRRTDLQDFSVVGRVRGLSSNAFEIAGLRIAFDMAIFEDFPTGMLDENIIVEVTGSDVDFSVMPPVLTATEIRAVTLLGFEPEDEVEIEGLVTSFSSASQFEINGQSVRTTASTQFENGSAADIAPNVRLEVEGQVNGMGKLEASKIVLKRGGDIGIEADAESVNLSAQTFRLLGLEVSVNALTRFEDESDVDLRSFGLRDIDVGNRIKMRGFLQGNQLVATRLEREDADEKVSLQAPVESEDEAAGTVTLLGLVVSGIEPGTDFEDKSDNSISQSDFYRAVTEGTLVKAEWEPFVSTSDPASELSIED